ncbi:general transcription factor iih subunit 2 [Anaeramoeba flamelloides]|uniref:General transcription factor IIH subunit n=1 Tax=Anaeramoeba flamelloides TaxID=1746091 RepID=A0AAV7ZCS4_9EUKA|nr:general transcription factor iih subunit [Anaeramoeba flamelloides]KAJ6244147.1 general transcription factor iih subunit 2 [Anaeramoeba flamelloides]
MNNKKKTKKKTQKKKVTFNWETLERTWEDVEEDENGRLQQTNIKNTLQDLNKESLKSELRVTETIKRGMLRKIVLVVDFSKYSQELDLKPSRLVLQVKAIEKFLFEYFDQNPISQLGIVAMRNGLADCISPISSNQKSHLNVLNKEALTGGDASLQNALELSKSLLSFLPGYYSKEVVIIFLGLSTCDPGNILETIKSLKKNNIRCSIIGLNAEMFLLSHLAKSTQGIYRIATNQTEFINYLLENAIPPPNIGMRVQPSMIKMGFPRLQTNLNTLPLAFSMKEECLKSGGYPCPRCKTRSWNLPSECQTCNLMLISSPHLARLYRHLFPIQDFEKINKKSKIILKKSFINLEENIDEFFCFGCRDQIISKFQCKNCKKYFCQNCNEFIHTTLHNCPGCCSLEN